MGVFYILVSQPFWALWVVSIQLDFPMRMYYLCTLLLIIIQWKDTHQYSSLHSCDSVSFFSLFFLCMLVRILNSKIYFLCFFLASLLIALIYYFYISAFSIAAKLFLGSLILQTLPGDLLKALSHHGKGENPYQHYGHWPCRLWKFNYHWPFDLQA